MKTKENTVSLDVPEHIQSVMVNRKWLLSLMVYTDGKGGSGFVARSTTVDNPTLFVQVYELGKGGDNVIQSPILILPPGEEAKVRSKGAGVFSVQDVGIYRPERHR